MVISLADEHDEGSSLYLMTGDPYGEDMTPITAAHLAESVAADGFTAHRTALAGFLGAAERRGANPVLLAVAGNAGEPEIARLRALGRLVVELAGPSNRSEAASEPPTRPVACGTSAA
jgi:hypothetical protein